MRTRRNGVGREETAYRQIIDGNRNVEKKERKIMYLKKKYIYLMLKVNNEWE